VFGTDYVTETALKLAAHTAVPDETIQDFNEFASYCQQEVLRQLVNEENRQLISGTGAGTTTTELLGFLATSGILTRAQGGDSPLDAIEIAIATLRNGPQLAEANLAVMHPLTWS